LCADLLARWGVGEVQASDGTDLHQVPVKLPAGSGAQDPTWSPDGSTIVFTVLEGDRSGIYTVNVDGTDLQQVTAVEDPQTPDWGPAPA
jgi:Tol biopolymer transport system component